MPTGNMQFGNPQPNVGPEMSSRRSGGTTAASDNSIDIANHSVSMTLTEPSDTVYLRGHNCKIEIGSGNTISNLYISGHNNKVFSKTAANENAASFGVIGNIEVVGHNNRIDSLISSCVKINGHNNRFTNLVYAVKEDFGICNQFFDCE